MYNSPFCKVEYLDNLHAVHCHWKQYCEGSDYRDALSYGLELIDKHEATTWITDTTNGFESREEDTQWLATEFSPKAIQSSCKEIIFIIKEDSPLKDEIKLHAQLLKQFFDVKLVETLEEI